MERSSSSEDSKKDSRKKSSDKKSKKKDIEKEKLISKQTLKKAFSSTESLISSTIDPLIRFVTKSAYQRKGYTKFESPPLPPTLPSWQEELPSTSKPSPLMKTPTRLQIFKTGSSSASKLPKIKAEVSVADQPSSWSKFQNDIRKMFTSEASQTPPRKDPLRIVKDSQPKSFSGKYFQTFIFKNS